MKAYEQASDHVNHGLNDGLREILSSADGSRLSVCAMRSLRVILLTLFFALACVPTTWAHARLVRAVPTGGAEVSPAPKQIDLWFNELLEDGFNTVTVFAAADLAATKRNNFTKGKPSVDAHDHTHLSIPLEALPPGEYIIEWRVLSRDGHSAPGRSTFRIRAS
jgi:methionine-rich copper-binding protein CopC